MFDSDKFEDVSLAADAFLESLMDVELAVGDQTRKLKDKFAQALKVRGAFDDPMDVLLHVKDLPQLMFKFGESRAYAEALLAEAETERDLWFEENRFPVLEKLTRDINGITDKDGRDGKPVAAALKKSPVAEDIQRATILLNREEWEVHEAKIKKLRRAATSMKNVHAGIEAWIKLAQPYLSLLNTCINKGLTDVSPRKPNI